MKEIKFNKTETTPDKNEESGFEWGTPIFDNQGCLNEKDGEILISGKDYKQWGDEFGLPLHLIYAPIMIRNVNNYKEVFEKEYPKGKIRFAAKVNPHPEIFKMMAKLGIGADVASVNEMEAALIGGIDPFNIDVNGNAKSDKLIKGAVSKNMFFIADSYEELKTINKQAELLNKKVRVALRISGFEMKNVTDANVFTAGVWSKFGENIKNIPDIIKRLGDFPSLDFHGFHTHIGSQVSSPDAYLEAMGMLVELALLLKGEGHTVKLINIGGGFPVSYVSKEKWEYLEERVSEGYISTNKGDEQHAFIWNNEVGGLAVGDDGKVDPYTWSGEKMYSEFPKHKMLQKVLTDNIKVNGKTISVKEALNMLGTPELVIEPGRSIAEEIGITLAKVSHVRKVAQYHELVTIEGNVTNYSTAMLLPAVNPWTIYNEPFKKDDKPFEAFIAGNLCYSGDIISKYKAFFQRKPKRGDVLGCYYTGAYNPGFFATNTNMFPRPARLLRVC